MREDGKKIAKIAGELESVKHRSNDSDLLYKSLFMNSRPILVLKG